MLTLPSHLEVSITVREEILWSEIIPSLTPELRSFEEWQALTVLVEYFDTHRLLNNSEKELNLLRELLEYNGNLLE